MRNVLLSTCRMREFDVLQSARRKRTLQRSAPGGPIVFSVVNHPRRRSVAIARDAVRCDVRGFGIVLLRELRDDLAALLLVDAAALTLQRGRRPVDLNTTVRIEAIAAAHLTCCVGLSRPAPLRVSLKVEPCGSRRRRPNLSVQTTPSRPARFPSGGLMSIVPTLSPPTKEVESSAVKNARIERFLQASARSQELSYSRILDQIKDNRPEALSEGFEWLGTTRIVLDKDAARDNCVTSERLFYAEVIELHRARDEADGEVCRMTWWGDIGKTLQRRAVDLASCSIYVRHTNVGTGCTDGGDDPWLIFSTSQPGESQKTVYARQSFNLGRQSAQGVAGINAWNGDAGPDGLLERAAQKYGQLQMQDRQQYAYIAIASALHDQWRENRWIGGTAKLSSAVSTSVSPTSKARKGSSGNNKGIIQAIARRASTRRKKKKAMADALNAALQGTPRNSDQSSDEDFAGELVVPVSPRSDHARRRSIKRLASARSSRQRRASLQPVALEGLADVAKNTIDAKKRKEVAQAALEQERADFERKTQGRKVGEGVMMESQPTLEARGTPFDEAMALWRTRRSSISRLAGTSSVLYEPRLKEVEGRIYDIANLPFEDLPTMYRAANIVAGKVALLFIESAWAEGVDIESKAFIERASANQHVAWMAENPWCTDPAQMCPYDELGEEEKDKDRDVIHIAIERATSYMELVYRAAVHLKDRNAVPFHEFVQDMSQATQQLRHLLVLDPSGDMLEADPAELHKRLVNGEFITIPSAAYLHKIRMTEDDEVAANEFTAEECELGRRLVELKRGASHSQIEFRADVAFDSFNPREHRMIGKIVLPFVLQVDALVHGVAKIDCSTLHLGSRTHETEETYITEVCGIDRITKLRIFKALQLLSCDAKPLRFVSGGG